MDSHQNICFFLDLQAENCADIKKKPHHHQQQKKKDLERLKTIPTIGTS